MLKEQQNTLFENIATCVDLSTLKAKATHKVKLDTARRQLRDVRRVAAAADAIAGFDHQSDIFGFTKGQFSLLDLIIATIAVTGPAHLSISTWTVASHEIATLADMVKRGDITGTRWLIDFSMARREPAQTAQLREAFGQQNIRVAQNHAKWCIFQNPGWRVVLRSSMNLNMNPRFEDFEIAHDPELAAFLNAILDEVWAKQTKHKANETASQIRQHFANDL